MNVELVPAQKNERITFHKTPPEVPSQGEVYERRITWLREHCFKLMAMPRLGSLGKSESLRDVSADTHLQRERTSPFIQRGLNKSIQAADRSY